MIFQTKPIKKNTVGAFIGSNYNADTLYDTGVYCFHNGLNAPSEYGTLFVESYRQPTDNTIPDYATQIFIPNGASAEGKVALFYRGSTDTTWQKWQKIQINKEEEGKYLINNYSVDKGADLDELYESGFYYLKQGVINTPNKQPDWWRVIVSGTSSGSGDCIQIAIEVTSNKMWWRSFGGTWTAWSRVVDYDTYSNKISNIETRLTNLGFKEGVASYSGFNVLTPPTTNSLKKQGKYVLFNFKIAKTNICKGGTPITITIPEGFRPKTSTPIIVKAQEKGQFINPNGIQFELVELVIDTSTTALVSPSGNINFTFQGGEAKVKGVNPPTQNYENIIRNAEVGYLIINAGWETN